MSFKAIFPCKNVLTFVTRKSFEIMSIHNYGRITNAKKTSLIEILSLVGS